jgi:hypothetical protein
MSVELKVETPRGMCRPDDGNFNPYQLPCLECASRDGVSTKLCQKAAERRNPLIERCKKFILFSRNCH